MININLLDNLTNVYLNIKKSLRNIYQKSNFYDKKISKISNTNFEYKPSPHLLSSIVKYQKKKYRINDFALDSIEKSEINLQDYKKLNNFFWFFSLDLKSSKKETQSIISNWIYKNYKFNEKSWEFDLTAKRIISWLSNHQLTYEDCNDEYKLKFNSSIQKQANYLLNEIDNSNEFENKIIGCAAIILTGLAYNDHKSYLENGLNLLRKIIKSSIDNQGFPRSRNIKQLSLYLKYFIIIREWFKESQNVIPEYIDENIYYLGQSYCFVRQDINEDIMFNGNYHANNDEFDQYLKRFGYKFVNENKEHAGYAILKNKNITLVMDVGPSPISKFSKDYQCGALSFEIISKGKKLFNNSGYFTNKNNKFNKFSKSSALQNTMIIEDHSSCDFVKNEKSEYIIKKGLKVSKKDIVFEDNYWKISASHDGYLKKFNTIHERKIEFYPEQEKFIGFDKILKKDIKKNIKFDIRFHLDPNSKVMKTLDNKSILIELENEAWRFSCDNFDINIDNGIYFGNKNSYIENQNIFISGVSNKLEESIKWEISKLQ